jgi:hypothetical protein
MAATIEIQLPDSLIRALGVEASELPRRSLEGLVVESYRSGRMTHAEVAEALGLNRWETDAFLKRSEAYRPLEPQEFANDLERLREIAK